MNKALIIVDVQNDFLPGGALAVPKGDEIIPGINMLIRNAKERSIAIIATKDFHPPTTKHFKSFGGPWPEHCVKDTKGADFPGSLCIPPQPAEAQYFYKGQSESDDGYSGFDGVTYIEGIPESLNEYLTMIKVRELFVVGLATDYCVKATVIDACKLGYITHVDPRLCRAVNINPGDEAKALGEMWLAGALLDG